MPRLFVGNFEFEHRLCEAHRTLPARLARLNAELASSWLAIADDHDFVWTPGEIPVEFWNQMAALGLPRLRPIADWTRLEADATLVPWGWTQELFNHARVSSWRAAAPSPDVVRQVNSRRWSAERETAWSVGLEHAAACSSVDDIAAAIARLSRHRNEWVLKAEFGMSGRERFVGRGELCEDALCWARPRIRRDGVLFFEPWVERIDEVGILWNIPKRGAPELIGVAPMLIADGGHYRGSRFAPVATNGWWDVAIPITARAAEEVRHAGYFGPFGIDAMLYRDAHGASCVRPLQDVNARWTMGRLTLGWRRFFPHVQSGEWWHGPVRKLAPPPGARMICTSPDSIDNQQTQHISAIVLGGQ
jgi:hypothetical protein